MIADRHAAETLFSAAYDAYHRVYHALEEITAELPPHELATVKQAVGRVMGEILMDLTEPILEQHPDLVPPEWRDSERR